MSSILNFTEAVSLALHSMYYLARNPDKVVANREIASFLGGSQAHLFKVLRQLTRIGLIASVRGPSGGFMLKKAPKDITLLNIYEAIEGPLTTTSCLLKTPVCAQTCILGDLITSINDQVLTYFSQTRLSDIAGKQEVP